MSDTGPGALVSAMLSAAIAGRADPTRFGRGRSYVREGAVVDLVVVPGELRAAVIGSRPSPYRVTVTVPGAPVASAGPGAPTDVRLLNRLVPRPDEMRCRCTCPDGTADPCKHAVAALLAFAQQVAVHPELLGEWRSGPDRTPGPGSAGPPPAPAASSSRVSRAMRSEWDDVPQPPPLSADEIAFFGDPAVTLPDLPVLEPLPVGSGRVGQVDLAAIVTDALDVIRSSYHRSSGRG